MMKREKVAAELIKVAKIVMGDMKVSSRQREAAILYSPGTLAAITGRKCIAALMEKSDFDLEGNLYFDDDEEIMLALSHVDDIAGWRTIAMRDWLGGKERDEKTILYIYPNDLNTALFVLTKKLNSAIQLSQLSEENDDDEDREKWVYGYSQIANELLRIINALMTN